MEIIRTVRGAVQLVTAAVIGVISFLIGLLALLSGELLIGGFLVGLALVIAYLIATKRSKFFDVRFSGERGSTTRRGRNRRR